MNRNLTTVTPPEGGESVRFPKMMVMMGLRSKWRRANGGGSLT